MNVIDEPITFIQLEEIEVMKKVAVFGNTGGGKSTLSKKLAEITKLPLYVLDKIEYEMVNSDI